MAEINLRLEHAEGRGKCSECTRIIVSVGNIIVAKVVRGGVWNFDAAWRDLVQNWCVYVEKAGSVYELMFKKALSEAEIGNR